MASLFSSIPLRPPKRNYFNLSHERKLTTDIMRLTPIMCEKTVGNERFSVTSDILVRMMATVAPIMHNINIYTHFFFVPRRLLWSDWQNYIGGGRDGQYNVPRITFELGSIIRYAHDIKQWNDADIARCFGIGSYMDYLGFPVQKWCKSNGSVAYEVFDDNSAAFNPAIYSFKIPIEPFMALFKIYLDYYRDENISPYKEWEDYVDLGYTSPSFWNSLPPVLQWPTDRDFSMFIIGMFGTNNRAWAKDIFTSALPWQQRGPAVSVPIGGNISIPEMPVTFPSNVSDLNTPHFGPIVGPASTGSLSQKFGTDGTPGVSVNDSDATYFHANGSLATPKTTASLLGGELLLQELRYTMKVQEFFEKDARGGYRYSEVLLSHFGVRPQDSRLQRSEYLGGGRSPLVVSQVANTSSGDASNPQANLAGLGFSRQKTHQFNYSTPEHGWIIGFMSIMPKANYMDGVPRLFYGLDRFSEYWPSFAHLGEQPIQNMELSVLAGYSDINDSSNPFGYTPRYAEYKTRQDSVHGAFRTTLKYWHMAREFTTVPTLSEAFIDTPPNSNRVFATSSDIPANTDHFLCQIYNRVKAIRPMPKYGVPHF